MFSIPRDLLSTACRARHLLSDTALGSMARALEQRQHGDGGYCGRSSASDLYYTLFGLAVGRVLGTRPRRPAMLGFLRSFADGEALDLVHTACLVQCRAATRFPWLARGRLRRRLEAFRAGNGYARVQGGPAAGPYTAYMALLGHQSVAGTPPRMADIATGVARCGTPDGAFSECPGRPGSVPVTAAATAVLIAAGDVRPGRAAGTAAWILDQRLPSGGLRATPSAPAADLLSTAVGLYALQLLNATDQAPVEASLSYLEGLWCDEGFGAVPGDTDTDCEYMFYGLLALGVIATALGLGGKG